MPARRKYREYSRVTISCDRFEREYIDDLGYTDSQAYHAGIRALSQKDIENHHVKQELINEMIKNQENRNKQINQDLKHGEDRLNWLLMMRDGKIIKDKKDIKHYSDFKKACEKVLGGNGELGYWSSKLAEQDPEGIYQSTWEEVAEKIGKVTGIPCTPGQCMDYVRGKVK